MSSDVVTGIIEEYHENCPLYSTFTVKIEKLVKELLVENNIRVHSVNSRLKSESSIRKKIAKKEKKYSKLGDITDFSGIRIVTFFADDVDVVAKIINNEFVVDKQLSVDKRELLDPDRFGYLSLHYVVNLSPSRLDLTEYHRFTECKTEMQIRSILQHAWAEIEHDLGYKSKQAVPREIQRRFSRIAGLLEVADTEFMQIRDKLDAYEKSVSLLISQAPETVSINKASLLSFLSTSPEIQRLDKRISSLMGMELEKLPDDAINYNIYKLEQFGFNSIKDLDNTLVQNEKIIEKFAKEWLSDKTKESKESEESKNGRKLLVGVTLFYLFYVLLGKTKSKREISKYVGQYIESTTKKRDELVKKIIETYEKVTSR